MADHLALVLVLVSCLVCSSQGYQFVVGGKRGWVVDPSEAYNHWAERMRFQVNDTLLFKYDNAQDSVLLVNRDDYDRCNTTNPTARMNGGTSTYTFDRSGPIYFISGNQTRCYSGQKLFIIVMSTHHHRRPTSPAPAPAPRANAPAPSPQANAPAPAASSPQTSLSPAPTGMAPSPSPVADGPAGDTTADQGHSFAGPALDPSVVMIISAASVVLGFLVV